MATDKGTTRRWSQHVTETSNALDLEKGVFRNKSPHAIAVSLKRSAEHSNRRKSEPFRSAMSMLTFYVNRGGRNLSAVEKKTLLRAKDELRKLYGRSDSSPAKRRARR
jgi:hypothetical protein